MAIRAGKILHMHPQYRASARLYELRLAELERMQLESGPRIAALEGELANLRRQVADLRELLRLRTAGSLPAESGARDAVVYFES